MRMFCDMSDDVISTHTLRGERDADLLVEAGISAISTHTLRGERDFSVNGTYSILLSFQLTRSVGSVTRRNYSADIEKKFQLTRSVGSVTKLNSRK